PQRLMCLYTKAPETQTISALNSGGKGRKNVSLRHFRRIREIAFDGKRKRGKPFGMPLLTGTFNI
ncbi:MAG: hypothetical protein ACLR16_12125, partial [Segatella copri]